MVQQKRGYPVSHQVLRFAEVELEDDATLASYELSSGCNVDIFLKTYSATVKKTNGLVTRQIKVRASDTISAGEFRRWSIVGRCELSDHLTALNVSSFPFM